MNSLKSIILFLSLVNICCCEEISEERGHGKKYVFLTKIAYLIFLGLKIKAVLIVGSIWGIALLFGKIFTLFKLLEYTKVKDNLGGHHEKIVYESPHGSSFFRSPVVYGKSHEIDGPPFSPDVTFDQPPSSETAEFPPSDFSDGIGGPPYDSPVYGRSNEDFVSMFANAIKKMNTTEMAFNVMGLKTEECKKKFVCETEFNVKQSLIVATAYDMFSDESYQKYKGNYTLVAIDDCTKLYPSCYDNENYKQKT